MKLGISQKAILLFVFFGVILTTTIGAYFIRRQNAILLSEFNERAKMLLSSTALNSEYPILIGDKENLDKIGKGVLKQKDVIFCEIIDNEGSVIFQGGEQKQSGALEYSSPVLSAQERQVGSEDLVLGLETRKIEEIGKILLSFSTGGLTKKMGETKSTAGLLIILGMILASFFINLLVKFVLGRPINKLMKGIEVISGGNLSYKVSINTKDEIGALADSFNRMTEDLHRITVSRDELIREVIERKKAEKNLKESKDILRHQKKSLEDTNKELDDFTYIISHDLKEPLRSIDAYSKFIVEDCQEKLSQEGKHYLERIRANTERMKRLIEDLLELSRLKRRMSTIEQVETMELIDEVKMRLEYMVKEKAVEIVIKDKLPKIFCDRVRLTEVFLNLISNAIKFNDKQRPIIEIGCNDKGGFYEFYVKDNGIGIKEEYFDKIFEIFQRLCKREDVEGTGAGLTIVKKIVQMHQGRIWLESIPQEGSVFYFTIPKDKSVLMGEKLFGEVLLEEKLVTEEDAGKALEAQRKINRIDKGGQNDGSS